MSALTATAPATVPTAPTGLRRAVVDTATMTRRNLLRVVRYPTLTVMLVGIPIVLLLLLVYVFGGALGAGILPGIEPGAAGRAAYLDYITPAFVVIAGCGVAQGTAIGIAMDMAEGIVSRFRTMAISPASVLGGNVIGATIQTMLVMGVLLGVTVLLGYRPEAGALDWLALAGVLLLFSYALTWMSVAMGINAKSVETASNMPMLFILLPILGSGFVPTDTMPTAVRWFAEHQPFTPVIETVRGLLAGGAGLEGSTVVLAVGWTLLIAAGGYAWARAGYRRERAS